jgi:ribosomal-protein-alanine N-acetyltransferase
MDTPQLTIRQLEDTENDLRQVIEIEALSFNKDDAYTKEDFKRWLGYNPDLCLVAEINSRIAGDMICRIHRYTLDLASCAIHPDYRRLGIASTLLQEMEKRAKQYFIHRIELEVRRSNPSGYEFWRSMGFEEFGSLPGFYPDGEDAVRMFKRI